LPTSRTTPPKPTAYNSQPRTAYRRLRLIRPLDIHCTPLEINIDAFRLEAVASRRFHGQNGLCELPLLLACEPRQFTLSLLTSDGRSIRRELLCAAGWALCRAGVAVRSVKVLVAAISLAERSVRSMSGCGIKLRDRI
jgi:hypothetical protein